MLLRDKIVHALTWGMNPVGIFHAQWNSASSVLMIRPARWDANLADTALFG